MSEPVTYPIPCGDLTPVKARALVCPRCGFTRAATNDELGLTDGLPPCPSCSPPWPSTPPPAASVRRWSFMEWKFYEAQTCDNCGKVGDWEPMAHCSRARVLQSEYARQIRGVA